MKKRDVKTLKGMFATKQTITVEEMTETTVREAVGELKFTGALNSSPTDGVDSDFERTPRDE